jgi:hypothetical protein
MASVNSAVAPLAMRIMDNSATDEEQREFGWRLITLGQRLHRRADKSQRIVEGIVLQISRVHESLDRAAGSVGAGDDCCD